jgi:hypothetical protein
VFLGGRCLLIQANIGRENLLAAKAGKLAGLLVVRLVHRLMAPRDPTSNWFKTNRFRSFTAFFGTLTALQLDD